MPRAKIGKRKAEYSSARAKGESLPGYITRMFQRVEGHSKEYGLLPSFKKKSLLGARERKDYKDSKKAFKRDKKKVQFKKEGGAMEPYFGSYISGTVDGKKLSNPSYKKYYGSLLRGMK